MENSLKQLKIKLQQKNLIIVGGNVYDTFISKKENVKEKFCSLQEKIVDMAKEIGYKDVVSFSPAKGKRYLLGEGDLEVKSDSQKNDEFGIFEEQNPTVIQKLSKFIEEMKDEIQDKDINNKVYIIDFSDTLFSKESLQELIGECSLILSTLLNDEAKIQYEITNLEKNSKIVFICRDSGNVASDFSSKNIEFASVNINKPNKNERDEIFNRYYSLLNVSDSEKLKGDTKEHINAVSLTEGFSIKEILQLGRIKTENEQLSFKELFSLAQFNKKDSEWEKINMNHLNEADKFFSEVVKGQEYAIEKVKQNLINASLGLNGIMHSENLVKPKGILFFSGPTGTGKTEMAKQIAKLVFGDENRIIRFDMSEYNHEHSDQRLIGAPPGYVGYDAGGELTNAVKENPFSVLLFDEVEKAHGKILDKFLQILEDGRLTSSKNELIDFSETFIIFTSNIGVKGNDSKKSKDEVRKKFIKAVEDHFWNELKRPELLNRIGKKNIIPFNYITDRNIFTSIVKSKLDKTINIISKKHMIQIHYTEDQLNNLVDLIMNEEGIDEMGGRGIINSLNENVINSLSKFMFQLKLENKISKEDLAHLKLVVKGDEKVVFELI